MNRCCPVCARERLSVVGSPVPYEDTDRFMTLHFCSKKCRDDSAEEGINDSR